MKRLAIIPARGNSKRIPKKNIRDFCGRPIIEFPLQAAINSDLFDTIHISTDDQEIEQVASDLGYSPAFARPNHLAEYDTPLFPVLKFVLET